MKHVPNGREERETAREGTREPVNKTARDRDPRTREQRKAVPTAGEVFATQHVETRHVEKNGTQCFKSGSQRQLVNKIDQCESNVIINTDQKGKLSQSEAENFRDEDETDQSKIETVWFG